MSFNIRLCVMTIQLRTLSSIPVESHSHKLVDYILCVGDPGNSLVRDVKVCRDLLNTSTHFPVIRMIPPVDRMTSDRQQARAAHRKKVLWAKLDKSNNKEYSSRN